MSIITPRSYCPHCRHTIAWYDNIPLLSFILLGGKCRACKKAISWLYPFIELLTVFIMTALSIYVLPQYQPAYFIFFSALIVTIRTDLEKMLISRYVTLFLAPLGWLLAFFDLIPISITQSIMGTLFGYLFLLSIALFFSKLMGKEGMGQGDLELLAFIGSFIGIWGCWISLLLASMIGSIFGICYLLSTRQRSSIKIPFGPFLALGAIIFVLFQNFFNGLLV